MKPNLPFPASLALAIAVLSGCKPMEQPSALPAETNAAAGVPPSVIVNGMPTNLPGVTNMNGTNPAVGTNSQP